MYIIGKNIVIDKRSIVEFFIQFNQYNFKALQKENNFWLYIVYNLKDKPKIIKLTKNEILKRAKFFYGWEIPIRKADL